MIISLLKYKEGKSVVQSIDTLYYDGLNDQCPPVKVITPMKLSSKIAILYPGASPLGEQHPKMEMLGILLAQNGYKVYIPRIPPLKTLNITSINVQWFIHFYKWILNIEEIDDNGLVMIGISYGGGIMLKSCLQMKDELPVPKTLLTSGTYSDAESTVRFLLNGEIMVKGKKYQISPHEWGLVVIFHNFLKNIDLGWDTIGVEEVLKLHIDEKFQERDELVRKLPKIQKGIANSVLSGNAIPEVSEICKTIMENEKDILKSLSPKQWGHNISQKVFIFHGANDSMVPFTESIQLADYIPNSELLISYIYEHKEISTDKGFFYKSREFIRMLQFFSKFYYHHEN